MVLNEIVGDKAKNVFIATVVACIVIGGIITVYLSKHAVIVGSSICGAYALIRVIFILEFKIKNRGLVCLLAVSQMKY